MIRTFTRRGLSASATALLLLHVPASQALAGAEWSEPVVFTGYSVGGDIVALTRSTAVVLFSFYDRGTDTYDWQLRRTTNGGRTWSRPRHVSTRPSAISGDDNFVDLVIERGRRVWYSRSIDSGRSFGRPRALSGAGAVSSWDVARGEDGVVAVTWRLNGATYIRVSTDNGRSFGPAHTVTRGRGVRYPSVAVGDGVIYVAYEKPEQNGPGSLGRSVPGRDRQLDVRRSIDYGQTWSAATLISRDADTWTLTADGKTAYVGYTDWDRDNSSASARFATIYYKTTYDSGEKWSQRRELAPRSWNVMIAAITVEDGVAHVTFDRCDPSPDTCDDRRVFYRQSTDGVIWSVPERVSPKSWDEGQNSAIDASGGRVYALYAGYISSDERTAVQVR